MFETLFNNVRHEVVRQHPEDLCLKCVDLLTRRAQSKGSERPSISAKVIKNADKNELSNQEMAWTVGTL